MQQHRQQSRLRSVSTVPCRMSMLAAQRNNVQPSATLELTQTSAMHAAGWRSQMLLSAVHLQG
jgi:hypothetical protein